MAEVKTGLESTLSYCDQTGTQGKSYYQIYATGSAGTKAIGAGTHATSGTRFVYIGSGYVFASGVVKKVTATSKTVAASAASGSFTCFNIEIGTDLTLDITGGTQHKTLGSSIVERAATQAGHLQIGYVTMTNPGSVLAGSIVDERTFMTPTAIAYDTGFDYEISDSPIHIYDGATYAHSKAQRQAGKLSYKQDFQTGSRKGAWPSTGGDYMTVPRVTFEVAHDGVAGTTEEVHLLLDAVCENESVSIPEEEKAGREYTAFFASHIAL